MNRERHCEGPDNLEDETEDTIGVGPDKWFELAEMGGGVERMKNRVPEARRGIRSDSRRERKRSSEFGSLLEASALGAAAVNERRLKQE